MCSDRDHLPTKNRHIVTVYSIVNGYKTSDIVQLAKPRLISRRHKEKYNSVSMWQCLNEKLKLVNMTSVKYFLSTNMIDKYIYSEIC